jgi:selenocysteine lyase/cysteine desulfurase
MPAGSCTGSFYGGVDAPPRYHCRGERAPPQRPAGGAVMLEAFLQAYPEYLTTKKLDGLRASEYSRLDAQGHVYLDYTGGGLYAECQIRDHLALMGGQVYGNPHSRNLTSLAMGELVEKTRAEVLRYFNASPDEYMAVFTQNATGALKLLAESYPFGPGAALALTADNHNSVNGIREFARRKGATVTYVPVVDPELRVDREALATTLSGAPGATHKLFGYPAQSNFSGVQHPLDWIADAQAQGWDVLVDAASFVPSNRFDLSRVHPDFVDISFYKIFGYPTGIGCLLARKETAKKLVRPWYAGGTITFSTVATQDHYLTPGPASFEDGTVNYLSIPGVGIGLEYIEMIGIDVIHTRVMCLAGWLLGQMAALKHSNGNPVVRIYGPADTRERGATLQMNFYDRDGVRVDCYDAEKMASAERISLRAGCHCNPGDREVALHFTKDDLVPCFENKERITYEQFQRQIAGKTTGALRLSVGLATNFADVSKYMEFARKFVDCQASRWPSLTTTAPPPIAAPVSSPA